MELYSGVSLFISIVRVIRVVVCVFGLFRFIVEQCFIAYMYRSYSFFTDGYSGSVLVGVVVFMLVCVFQGLFVLVFVVYIVGSRSVGLWSVLVFWLSFFKGLGKKEGRKGYYKAWLVLRMVCLIQSFVVDFRVALDSGQDRVLSDIVMGFYGVQDVVRDFVI